MNKSLLILLVISTRLFDSYIKHLLIIELILYKSRLDVVRFSANYRSIHILSGLSTSLGMYTSRFKSIL